MKKAIILGILLLGFFSSSLAVEAQIVFEETTPPTISILEPRNGAVCYSDSIDIIYRSTPPKVQEAPTIQADRVEIAYVLSGERVVVFSSESFPWLTEEIQNRFILRGLSDGFHKINVTATYFRNFFHIGASSTLTFTVNTSAKQNPQIIILQLENQTFTSPDAPLTFFVNKPHTGLKYSLDGQANVSISGNTTLWRLSNGQHSVWVYAQVSRYNASLGYVPSIGYVGGYQLDWISNYTHFTVNAPIPNPTPTLLPTETSQPSPPNNPSPSVPEFPTTIIMPLVFAASLTTLPFIKRKERSPN